MHRVNSLESSILGFLDRVPFISFYAKTRGWPYVIAWCHRFSGLILVAYLWLYIFRLFSLSSSNLHDAMMKSLFFPGILGLALAIPLILHTLNGGRLILYESFGKRNDRAMIRWVFWLSILYTGLLALIILLGNQGISPFLFWLISMSISFILGYVVISRIRNSSHSLFWKLQRMTGGFLMVMVPAYFLFMHLNPFPGMETGGAILWVENVFAGAVHFLLLMAALYHGAYGLFSVIGDYLSSRILRMGFAFLITVLMLIFAWMSIKLTSGTF